MPEAAHLDGHAESDQSEHALGIVHLTEALKKGVIFNGSLLIESGLHLAWGSGEPALGLGDMEELAVAGLEQGDAEGIPDAHDPILGHLWGEGPQGVAELDGYPVEMKEDDASEG